MQEKKEKKGIRAAFDTGFVLPSRFHLEADGPENILVEGCTGIQLYEPERIRLGAGRQALLVTGNELVISSMFGSTLCICGHIVSIEFV